MKLNAQQIDHEIKNEQETNDKRIKLINNESKTIDKQGIDSETIRKYHELVKFNGKTLAVELWSPHVSNQWNQKVCIF